MASFLKGPKDLQYAIVVLQGGSTVISPSVGNSTGSFAMFARSGACVSVSPRTKACNWFRPLGAGPRSSIGRERFP